MIKMVKQQIIEYKGVVELRQMRDGTYEVLAYIKKPGRRDFQYHTKSLLIANGKYNQYLARLIEQGNYDTL